MNIPRPATINGDLLAGELAAAGFSDVTPLDNADGTITLSGLPDEADPAAVEAVVAAHDPEVIHPDERQFPADGTTAARVRWQRLGAANTDVPYEINGLAGIATADTEGIVELAVTASTPSPVYVTVGNLSITLIAEEV